MTEDRKMLEADLNELYARAKALRAELLTVEQEIARQQGAPLGDIQDECRALIRQHRTLDAIRVYRARIGCGLREAKDAVDSIRDGGIPAAL